MTLLLLRAGLRVQHETLDQGDDGTVSCYALNSQREWSATLHQVRHPLVSIGSLVHLKKAAFWRRMGMYEMEPLPRSIKVWLEWNRRCEEAASLTYRIEDIESAWPEIRIALGHPDLVLHRPIEMIGEHGLEPLTWEDLGEQAPAVRSLAQHYGYDTETT